MKRFAFIAINAMLFGVLFLSGSATAGNKVKLCHYPPGNPENWRIIAVSENALEAHLAHGDMIPMICYEDADGDGFGNSHVSTETCEMPEGFADDNTDCNDADAFVNPGATEMPGDGLDNDCNPGTPDGPFKFSGILKDVPKSKLQGWSICYQDTYVRGLKASDIKSKCTKANIMLACGRVGSNEYKVVAHGPHADVFYETGNGNTPHNANGVGWYFSNNYSMGFAPEGYGITRSSCDIEEELLEERLCWHTYTFVGGWSCGRKRSLMYDDTWERVVLQAD